MKPPAPYRHSESSILWIGSAVVLLLTFTTLLLSGGRQPVILAGCLALAITLLLTHSLSLSLDELRLEIRLGNGWMRRRVDLEQIEGIQRLDQGPFWGLGLRATPLGRIYAFGTTSALQLKLRDEATAIVVGVAAIEELEHELRMRLRRQPSRDPSPETERG